MSEEESAIRQRVIAFIADAYAWNQRHDVLGKMREGGEDPFEAAERDKAGIAKVHAVSICALDSLGWSMPPEHCPEEEVIESVQFNSDKTVMVETVNQRKGGDGRRYEYELVKRKNGWRISKLRQVYGDKASAPEDAMVLDVLRTAPPPSLPDICIPEGLAKLFEGDCFIATPSGERQTRMGIEDKLLHVPSGWLACDDPGYWYTEASTFELSVPPGSYAVHVVRTEHETVAVKVIIQPEQPAVRYTPSSRMDLRTSKARHCAPAASHGIGVDTGTIGLADAGSLYAMSFYEREKMVEQSCKVSKREKPTGIRFTPMSNGIDFVSISTGGDGGFPAYWALDAQDRPVALLLDMVCNSLPIYEEFVFPVHATTEGSLNHPKLADTGVTVRFDFKPGDNAPRALRIRPSMAEIECAVTDRAGTLVKGFDDSGGGGNSEDESMEYFPRDFRFPPDGHVHLRWTRGQEYRILPPVPVTPANTADAFARIWNVIGCHGDSHIWHERIKQAYETPASDNWRSFPRYYHNWRHLTACLVEFDSARPHFSTLDLPIIEMALWFHDAVYNPKSTKNEEESARVATEVLGRNGASKQSIDKICSLILATKAHPFDVSPDAALLLDIDLSIFGQPSDEFERYEQAFRAEYSWVPWAIYAQKRHEILRKFLGRQHIYLTPYFRERYEHSARMNLERAVQRLRLVLPT